MKKLYVVFSAEAIEYVEDHGFDNLSKQKKLTQGYDWDIKEFESKEIMDAYTQGLADAQGWDSTDFCELTVENGLLTVENKLSPKYIVTHIIDDEDTTEFLNDAELIHFTRNIAIENDDEELSITTINEATEYIISSCENLRLKQIHNGL